MVVMVTADSLILDPVRALRFMRELLENRERWTKTYLLMQDELGYSTTRRGVPCQAMDDEAYAFSMQGAYARMLYETRLLRIIVPDDMPIEIVQYADMAIQSKPKYFERVPSEAQGGFWLFFGNDPETTHQEVLDVLDKAIELAGDVFTGRITKDVLFSDAYKGKLYLPWDCIN